MRHPVGTWNLPGRARDESPLPAPQAHFKHISSTLGSRTTMRSQAHLRRKSSAYQAHKGTGQRPLDAISVWTRPGQHTLTGRAVPASGASGGQWVRSEVEACVDLRGSRALKACMETHTHTHTHTHIHRYRHTHTHTHTCTHTRDNTHAQAARCCVHVRAPPSFCTQVCTRQYAHAMCITQSHTCKRA
jgi:hypothetical protein